MKKSSWVLIGVGVLILILLLTLLGTYNGLVSGDENVKQKWANVQTAYQRRADLIPNLVEVVKSYRDYEAATLTKIVELRSEAGQAKTQMNSATTPAELEQANLLLDNVRAGIKVIFENYPDLKASENFLSLNDEISGTENRIKVDRDNFNEAVRDYNVKVRRFPSNVVAGWFGFGVKTSFQADEGAEKVVKVGF